ncbi:hypothetical protein [Nonomuraea sp. 10N515B]|uniref:hypothetical protein n=1 Tax=Nonomuraea sp. 10N515B TaxID=3457422 RepID=UPI003FCE052E
MLTPRRCSPKSPRNGRRIKPLREADDQKTPDKEIIWNDETIDQAQAAELRDKSADELIAAGHIRSAPVEAAFRTVPRHAFVPADTLPWGSVGIVCPASRALALASRLIQATSHPLEHCADSSRPTPLVSMSVWSMPHSAIIFPDGRVPSGDRCF